MLRPGYREFTDYLNDLIKLDPLMVDRLVNLAIPCNKEIGEHPTVICWIDVTGYYMVRFLGIINGFYGSIPEGKYQHCGPIAAIVEGGMVIGFKVLGEDPDEEDEVLIKSNEVTLKDLQSNEE